jgi:regulator of RNase E activity RraA
VVRDVAGVLGTGLPVWCSGVAAPPSVAGLTFVDWQRPIGCGGVAVFPGDVIVVDDDGAVLIPAALLDEMLVVAPEQERLEAWIMSQVEQGVPLPGLYPPNAENKARYLAACQSTGQGGST